MENTSNIYIKRGPDFFGLNEISSQKLRESIERVLALRTKDNAKDVEEIIKQLLGDEKLGAYISDFSGTQSFWVRKDVDDKIILEACNMTPLKASFYSEEELEKKFINIKDFLKDAEYVGRYYTMTSSSSSINSYMDLDTGPLVLYSNGAYMLTAFISSDNDNFLISILYPGNLYYSEFRFTGEKNNDYNDKDAIYDAICKQVYSDAKKHIG